jgi:hypothetical protein
MTMTKFPALREHYAGTLRVAPDPNNVFGETVSVLAKFMASAWQILDDPNVTAAAKRSEIISQTVMFYNTNLASRVAAAVNHPFIYNNMIKPAIDAQLPIILGQAYDSLVAILSKPLLPPSAAKAAFEYY